jgi:tetratricopeptide (TPR) repeat protein
MEFVYQGKTRLAIDYLESFADSCGGEPFYLLVKSRVARELLTVDDENKDQVKADAEPILRDLEAVIELCSRRMDDGNEDPNLRLCRGLAWMSRSHLHSFARKFWRAGREAKKGKSDLEKYLEIRPDDALAQGTMGVFLYFADTIPSVFKYLSKILFMPSGDREKGLRYIDYASENPSFLKTEFEVVRYNIDLLFEGEYESGIEGTIGLVKRYPGNPRVAMPLALMLPFDPFGVPENARIVDDTIEGLRGFSPGDPERSPLTLLEFLNAYANRFVAPPDIAVADLRAFADDNPDHPDWVGGYAAFELGRLLASLGDADEARSTFDWVGHNNRVGYLHDDASRLSKALHDIDKSVNVPRSMWMTEIYFGEHGDRENAIEDIRSTVSTPISDFYLGEALLLNGDFDEALVTYEELIESDVDPWNVEFKMLAASRIAEIHGSRGDFESASQWLDRAADYYQKEFLVDWVLEGRKRHYERLKESEEPASAPPSLLTQRR